MPQVQKMCEGDNDRVKMMVLFAGEEEDDALVRAASGALAFISSNTKLCQKIVQVSHLPHALTQPPARRPGRHKILQTIV